MAERQIALDVRKAVALESIARSLELIVEWPMLGAEIVGNIDRLGACVAADDSGRTSFRITGELIGGEGDVPVEAAH